MRELPKVPRRQSTHDECLFRFGGMKRRKAAGDGDLYDVYNMTSEDYPAVSARAMRQTVYDGFQAVYGLGSTGNKLFWCADGGQGAHFYFDGQETFSVSESQKRFAVIGQCVTIWPDQKYYCFAEVKNADAPYATLDDLYEACRDSQTIADGDLYAVGTSAPYHLFLYNSAGTYKKNRFCEGESFGYQTQWTYLSDQWGDLSSESAISGNGDNFDMQKSSNAGPYDTLVDGRRTPNLSFLRPNDVVRVTVSYGTRTGIAVRKMYTARLLSVEAYADETAYTFDAAFDMTVDGHTAYSAKVTRYIPPLSHVFCHDNRLFGCADGKIYASALGDPFNFLDYSLSDAASYAVAVSGADFTGAVSYGGYPTFFTENSIYRLSGAYPSEYRLFATMSVDGVSPQASLSPAVCDGVLYYRASAGVCAYTGSYPRLISADIEGTAMGQAGGASAHGYYLGGGDGLLVYDTRRGTWHRENGQFSSFTRMGSRLFAASAHGIVCVSGADDAAETVESALEFAPLYDRFLGVKGLSELSVVVESPSETTITLSLSREGGPYQLLALLAGQGRRTHTVPVPLRGDSFYQIKLEGRGPWTLYALGRHQYYGTNRP